MTLQEIKKHHAYSSWAANILFDALATLPAEQLTRDMKSSHGSILETLAHMVAAEKLWLTRWLGSPDAVMMTTKNITTLAALRQLWETIGRDIAKFLGTLNDRKLQETFQVHTATGDTFTYTFQQALLHVVDHSTYHRGQVIGMMRQLGVKPPATGMTLFFRQTKS